MAVAVRRLGPADEPVLELLAREDAEFGLDAGAAPRRPLPPTAARAYLADPNVLHWVAERDHAVVGFLYGHVLRRRCGEISEVLIYEIGVRAGHRGQGVGRALMEALRAWMDAEGIREAWVVAHTGAVDFYRACGFSAIASAAPMQRLS